MANDTDLNPGVGGDKISTDDLLGVKTQNVKLRLGATGVDDGLVDAANPLPVDVGSFAGTAAVVGPGPAASALRVELPTNGQGVVRARNVPVTSAPTTVATVPFTEVDTVIVAANPDRKSVLLYNDGNFEIFLGIGEAASLLGQKLIPGAYLIFDCIGAINGFNLIANGEDVDVRATDETY